MLFCSYCGTRLEANANRCLVCQQDVPQMAPPPPAPAAAWLQQYDGSPSAAHAPVNPPAAHAAHRPYDPVAQVWTDLKTFDFKWIVPYDKAFSPEILENPSTWVMLLFGFFPLAILGFDLVHTVTELLFFFCAYFMLAWSAYFYIFVAKKTTDYKLGLGAMVFTAIFGVAFVLALQTIPPFSILYAMAHSELLPTRMIGYILGVGVNEEVCKALPVLLIAFSLKKIAKPLDGIFYGALSGLGFGMIEGMKYVGASDDGASLLVQSLIRTTSLPFMHALWCSISGYFIALAMVNRHRRGALIVAGLAIVAVGHGLYDSLSGGPVGVALAACLYLLFIAYLERSQDMVRELEKAEAVATAAELVGHAPGASYSGQASIGPVADPAPVPPPIGGAPTEVGPWPGPNPLQAPPTRRDM